MKKIIVLLIIALAVVVGVLYFSKVANAPDVQVDVLKSFSNWKTYDGKSTIGLTLKYPADWTVDDSYSGFVSFMPADGNGFNLYREKPADKKQTLSKWLKARDKENSEAMGGQYQDKVLSTKKTKVAKLSAIRRVEYADAAGFNLISTYLKKGDYIYTFAIQMGGSGYYDSADEKVYNKILSTVQFTK